MRKIEYGERSCQGKLLASPEEFKAQRKAVSF